MSDAAGPFDVIGRSIVESLQGVRWRTAWLRASLPEPGVMNRQQRYVDDGDGVEKDFVLRGVFKVMDAMEAHLADTTAKGFPAWTGLTFRIDPAGKFDVEYSYREP